MRAANYSHFKIVAVNLAAPQRHKAKHKTAYRRPKCPRCSDQAHCRRLNDAKGWCGRCQQGFPLP